MSDIFADLPLFGFDVIVADPPWRFELFSEAGEEKSAQAQYECMSLDAIKALPVANLVGDGSWLFMWATSPLLPEAIDVLRAWGFVYKTALAWAKVTRNGKRRMGTGYIARTMHEHVLVGAMGSPVRGKPMKSLFDGIARQHSRKPDEFYKIVETFAPAARRLDLFSRQSRPGWTSFGLEAGKFDVDDSAKREVKLVQSAPAPLLEVLHG